MQASQGTGAQITQFIRLSFSGVPQVPGNLSSLYTFLVKELMLPVEEGRQKHELLTCNLLSILLRCGTRPYERGTQWWAVNLLVTTQHRCLVIESQMVHAIISRTVNCMHCHTCTMVLIQSSIKPCPQICMQIHKEIHYLVRLMDITVMCVSVCAITWLLYLLMLPLHNKLGTS